MCGFVGFTGDKENKEAILNDMLETIAHRGPDEKDSFHDDEVSFGFRRLSIIDIAEGGQPLYNEDKSIVLMLNGEIYNYKELRTMLEEKGHKFYTNSDAETIIHLYEEYKIGLFDYVRGMFSFVIYDKNENLLFGARDFFGIKPLYYYLNKGNILFGSEIKALLHHPDFTKEINLDALEQYMTFQYSVMEETFFKGVYKLLPAHYFIFKDGEIKTERYWEPRFNPEEKSLVETIDQIDNVMQDSLSAHKISDVEVGSFLSSGVDSSFIASCSKKYKTFTVGFDYEKYNEIEYAKKLSEAIGSENYSKIISTEDYWNILPKVQYHMDEPLADPSAIALYFVSELASKHVKVVLSGEGADELFGGYNIYRQPLDLKIVTDLPKPIRKFFAKVVSLIPFNFKGKNFFIGASKEVEERFIGNANIFNSEEKKAVLKHSTGITPQDITKPFYDKVKDLDDITKMQYIDINLWLVGDILLKADKMSMAHSLEVRTPFLDKEVFEIASKIQTDFRVNRTATKYAFRMAAKEYMPQEVADKKKLGFPVPIRIWLREDKYYNMVKECFSSEAADKFFNKDKLIELLDEHKKGGKDNSRKIWTVYMFLVWYKEFF